MGDLKINIEQIISKEHFEEIIITALEGGSNYWYLIKHDDLRLIPTITGENKAMAITRNLFERPEFSLDVYDLQDEDELLGTITQGSLLKALKICYKDYNQIYVDLIEGTGDAETADIIFQIAVMGEVTFG